MYILFSVTFRKDLLNLIISFSATEGKGEEEEVKKLENLDDVGDIAKTSTLVSTNKAFYRKIPMV